jgi:hypothetical protein
VRLHPSDASYNPAADLIESVSTMNMLPLFAADDVNAAQQHQSTKPIRVPDLDASQQNQRNASGAEWFNIRYDGPDWSAWITHKGLAEFGGSAPPGAIDQSRPVAAPPVGTYSWIHCVSRCPRGRCRHGTSGSQLASISPSAGPYLRGRHGAISRRAARDRFTRGAVIVIVADAHYCCV